MVYCGEVGIRFRMSSQILGLIIMINFYEISSRDKLMTDSNYNLDEIIMLWHAIRENTKGKKSPKKTRLSYQGQQRKF